MPRGMQKSFMRHVAFWFEARLLSRLFSHGCSCFQLSVSRLNRRLLAPPAPAGSLECPSLSLPHPAPGCQTSGLLRYLFQSWCLPDSPPVHPGWSPPSPHLTGCPSLPPPVAPGLHILVHSLQPKSPPQAPPLLSPKPLESGCQGIRDFT